MIYSDLKLDNWRSKIPLLYHYLLIIFAFSLPISVAVNNMAGGLIFLLWLVEGNFSIKVNRIRQNPVVVWSMVFLLTLFVGLLWTDDMASGSYMIKKEIKFLLLPILITIIEPKHIKVYFVSFLSAIVISEVISYLLFFGLIAPISSENLEGFMTPFIDHISYAPYLAFTIYILLHQLFFSDEKGKLGRAISVFFILTMSFNLFISGGRAGQVGFFVIYAVIILQVFHKNIFKAIGVLVISIPLIFVSMYYASPVFKARVNVAVENIKNFQYTPDSPVGKRIIFTMNSLPIIAKHPLMGVGTGDFKEEYAKVNSVQSSSIVVPDQPHNMYLLILVQLGLFGFIPFMMIFISQIKASLSHVSRFYRIQMALPVLFLVIMLSDSYLLGHHTTMLFIFLSSILFLETTWQHKEY